MNKLFEIWIGYYHHGTGHDGSTKPEMVGLEIAPDFRTACVIYELKSSLKSIQDRVALNEYIDQQSCRWFYDFETNSNSWMGQYFETKEEALKTFK